MDKVANKIAEAIIKDKKAFNSIKKSMSWRLTDIMIDGQINLRDEVRAIVIQELPNAFDMWLASGEEE